MYCSLHRSSVGAAAAHPCRGAQAPGPHRAPAAAHRRANRLPIRPSPVTATLSCCNRLSDPAPEAQQPSAALVPEPCPTPRRAPQRSCRPSCAALPSRRAPRTAARALRPARRADWAARTSWFVGLICASPPPPPPAPSPSGAEYGYYNGHLPQSSGRPPLSVDVICPDCLPGAAATRRPPPPAQSLFASPRSRRARPSRCPAAPQMSAPRRRSEPSCCRSWRARAALRLCCARRVLKHLLCGHLNPEP